MRRLDRRIVLWRVAALILAATAPLGFTTTGQAQGPETAVRVAVYDAGSGDLTLLDPEPAGGEVVGRFSTPTPGYAYLYPSGNGRYVLANHYEGRHVTILDSGLATQDHGDHVDLVEGAPFVRATVATGATPAHPWADDGVIAVHNDGNGTVTLFDEAMLDEEIAPATIEVAQPDHSSIAVVDGTVLVGYYDLGRVDAYGVDGALVRENVGACPEAHGETHLGSTIAFACADGLLLVDVAADLRASKVSYPAAAVATPTLAASPAASPEATPEADAELLRIGGFAAAEDGESVVGDYGRGVVIVRPDGAGAAFREVPLPAEPVGMAFAKASDTVVVLTDDGAVHGIDAGAAEIRWSTPAVTPYSEISIGTEFRFYPQIAASEEAVYVPDPETGEVVELNVEDGAAMDRFDIGGQPSRVTLVTATGVVH